MRGCGSVRPRAVRACLIAVLSTLCLLGGGCGGGGGSGGGGGPGAQKSVKFLGFAFRVGSDPEFTTPPVEDLTSTPSTVGAPLNLTVIFRFNGKPSGPFNATTLPVFTTAKDLAPQIPANGSNTAIPAKGAYVPVGDTVEFRPFVPTAPVVASFNASPSAVPGFMPGSTYTVRIATAPGQRMKNLIPDLGGVPGEVKFGTSSNPAAWFPTTGSDGNPPGVTGAEPADGSVDFFPGSFATESLASPGTPLFPPGPDSIQLTYDRQLRPTEDNLLGADLDADGLLDPTFFLRSRATRILVAHEVPADTFGVHAPFAALSGLDAGVPPSVDGADVFSHADTTGALPDPDPGFAAPVASMASDLDASLLWTVHAVDGGTDLLSVADHVLGDPSHGQLAISPAEGTAAGALDTGLEDLTGLTMLLDGRLVAYDRATRRIHELLPTVVRRRPAVDVPEALAPELVALTVGDGTTGFLSDPQPASAGDVVDLALAPSGQLYALAVLGGDPALPSILRLAPVDFDLDGVFDQDDGLFSGLAEDVVLALVDEYTDMVFVSDTEVLALNRTTDSVDRIDLVSGAVSTEVPDVGAFGTSAGSWPDGLSPARALAVGHMELDVDLEVLTNGTSGATLRLRPVGVLPIGADVTVMQRNTLASLYGTSLVNADPTATVPLLGAVGVLDVRTSEPVAGAGAVIDDTFLERFSDRGLEDGTLLGTNPLAEWAGAFSGVTGTPGLRASVGVSETPMLGDFVPQTHPNFDETKAYDRTSPAFGEEDLSLAETQYTTILLDTDSQLFPLPSGATPGITNSITVLGGRFSFRDIIIPEGVEIVARGSNPLVLTATRRVEINGVLNMEGRDGLSDDSFDTGFVPVPGGPGGPGAGRGGDGHPTEFDPSGPGTLDQYVTPETGERGWGPVIGANGQVSIRQIGGFGGLTSAGYDPAGSGIPRIPGADNDEHHRSPGGGGGTYATIGQQAHEGSGSFLVQSSSTWFPFTNCPTNNKRSDAEYGNGENFYSGRLPNTPLQCVYMIFKPGFPQDFTNPEAVNRLLPGGLPGDAVFTDGDLTNDFVGTGGELPVLLGGQGGGGGGSRVDSLRHLFWARTALGFPEFAINAPPWYPKLFLGVFMAPTLYDVKGGGGGGGGGAVQIRSFGDIVIGRLGVIDASGGHGGGAEVVQTSSFGGGGGGGSGGAILLQAAGKIRIEADENHVQAGYTDFSFAQGANLDVSGGMGRDARTLGRNIVDFPAFTFDSTRSDGGQGGFGLIQLQTGDGSGMPEIQQGAFLHARQRSVLKQGTWTGDAASKQADHPDWSNAQASSTYRDDHRYVDMLHYRYYELPEEGPFGLKERDQHYVINGSFPPLIPSTTGTNGSDFDEPYEYPPGSGQFWWDTRTATVAGLPGRRFIREPQPEFLMKTYNGFDEDFEDINNPASDPDFPKTPGTLWSAGDDLPLAIQLVEPDGTIPMAEVDGQTVFDPSNLVEKFPVVHPSLTPPPFGTLSTGTSEWLDFNGVALRMRDATGRPPPVFEAFHGTHNDSSGEATPVGKDSIVMTGATVVGKPAHYVRNSTSAGGSGLLPGIPESQVPFNDVRVNAPDPQLLQLDAVSDNATVSVRFQGAYPVRPGSRVPDEESASPWVSDLTDLSGYPLVRFRVSFDIGVDLDDYPFGVSSYRPLVEYLRIRARY